MLKISKFNTPENMAPDKAHSRCSEGIAFEILISQYSQITIAVLINDQKPYYMTKYPITALVMMLEKWSNERTS